MPQVVTPLVQLLNQGNFQQPADNFGQQILQVEQLQQNKQQQAFNQQIQGTKLQEFMATSQQNREISAAQEQRAKAKSRFNELDRAEQKEFRSEAILATRMLPSLEIGDIAGANKILALERKKTDIDRETLDEFEELLGQPDLALEQALASREIAKNVGVFGSKTRDTSGNVQSSEIQKDGTIIGLTRDAQQFIIDPKTGITTFGKAALPLIVESRKREAGFAGQKAAAVEEAKLGEQLKFKPLITEAVKRKENEAKQRGAVFTELNRDEAALPGLKTVVGKLKVLASEATFTLAGRGFDTVAKEVLGFATKGATARDKMTSIINNQVLPLLRPIFGAQFTEREGDRLIAAFADVNSTPESRNAQLDSFLSQMERNIESKRQELQGIEGGIGQQQPTGQFTPQPSNQPEGTTATGPDGQRIITRNGQWVTANG